MLVIENPNGRMNAGERAFIAHQRATDGIALVNFVVGGGGPRKPGREVDAIIIRPGGIVCVEVKATGAVGELDSPANDAWSIGGIAHPFSSRAKSPAAQADQAAKILATALGSGPWPKYYVTPAVAIHGSVTIPERVRWVGTVGVATVEHFGLLAQQSQGKRIQARHVGPILSRLGVGKANIPDVDALIAMGFAEGTEQHQAPERQHAAKRETPDNAPKPSQGPPKPDTPTDGDQEPTRRRPLLLRELTVARGRSGSVAALFVVVTLGVWQLFSGDVFRSLAQPVIGERYFIYGTWTPAMDNAGVMVLPPETAITGLMLGAALSALCAIGLWFRFKIGGVTSAEILVYLCTVFASLSLAPALLRGPEWLGVAWFSLAYTVVWPIAVMVLRDLRKPFARYIEHLRSEYQW